MKAVGARVSAYSTSSFVPSSYTTVQEVEGPPHLDTATTPEYQAASSGHNTRTLLPSSAASLAPVTPRRTRSTAW